MIYSLVCWYGIGTVESTHIEIEDDFVRPVLIEPRELTTWDAVLKDDGPRMGPAEI